MERSLTGSRGGRRRRRVPRRTRATTLIALAATTACVATPPPELPESETAAPIARAWLGRAAEQQRAGAYEEALRSADAALEASPDFFRAHRIRQDILLALGRSHDARIEAARALVERPGDCAAYVLAARVSDDPARAEELLAAAIKKDGRYHWALLGRGVEAARAQRPDDAEAWFTRALDVYPSFPEARLLRARLRDDRGEFEGAAADYRWYLRVRPGDTEVLYDLAALLHRDLRRPDEAEEYYRLILDLDEGMTAAVVGLAVRATERAAYERAASLYRTIVDRDPYALFNLGLLCQERLGRPEEARQCFERFLAYDGPGADERSLADRLIYAPLRIRELEGDVPTESRP